MGPKQLRNSEMEDLLKGTFTTREEFMEDPAHLWAAIKCAFHGCVRIPLIYGWMPDSYIFETRIGQQLLTAVNIGGADQYATQNGGPYVHFNSVDCLYDADAGYQEPGVTPMFVWAWVKLTTLASSQSIVSKYDINGNNCSWLLTYLTPVSFYFAVNGTGNPVNNVVVSSGITPVINTWYFIAGFYNTSTNIRCYAAAANETSLNWGDNAVGVPALLFNGTAPLALGSAFNNAPTLYNPVQNGFIGLSAARLYAGTSDNCLAYASRLFQLTRWFYQQ